MSRRPVPAIFLTLIAGLFFAGANVWPDEAHAQTPADQVQMRNAKRALAEFGNYEDDARNARVVVEIGDGAKLLNKSRTINYTVDGTASHGDGKDYTIDGCEPSLTPPTTCTVELPANRHSAVITINIKNDGLDENDETIILTLKGGTGYKLNNAKNKTTLTIRDDDTRGLTFHRRWPDVPEGGSQTYTVKLKSQPTAAVTVNIASDNPDVTVTPTSLTFNPSGSNLWSTARQVTVDAAQDSDAVDDEATLTHTTSGGDYGGANALSIGRSVSVDDDDPRTTTVVPQLPRISLTGGAAVPEGSPASFTVNADRAPTARLTVNLEVVEPGGGDFVAASEEGVRTVTLNAGATSTTFTVPTVNDNTEEVDGAVLVLVNAGTGYSAGDGDLVNVNDNDGDGPPPTTPTASFASGSSSAAESAGTHNVTVSLSSAAPSGALTVGYSVTGTATAGSGNDFTIQNSGTLSVAAGDTSATIPVAINDDTSAESDETVILVLTGGTGYTLGSPSVHTLTITDNDGTGQATLSLSGPTGADEGNSGTSDRYFTVSLSSAPSRFVSWQLCFSGSATIDAAGGGTIPAGADYQAISGQTPIDLRGRSPVCTSRTFKTTDSSFTNTDLGIRIKGDTESESDETVTMTLRIDDGPDDVVLGTSVVTYTIRDDDATSQPTAASFASGSSSAAENAGTRNVRVNLFPAAPSGGLTLSYGVTGTAAADSDFTIRNSGTLRVAAEATSAVIPVAISDDRTEENDETVILTLTDGTGYTLGSTRVHTLTITDNDGTGSSPTTPVASFASASSSAAESAGTRNVRVNLSEAAPSGGLSLGYNVGGTATAGSDFTISNSGTVRVTARATTVTIPVAINDDSTTESAETVILTLTGGGTGYTLGSPRAHTLTITDNDPDTTGPPGPGNNGGNQGVSGSEGEDDDENDQDGQNQDPTPATSVVAFTADTSRPSEDADTANVTVTLTPAPAAALTVHYTVTGTATAGRDFTALAGAVTVSAGASRVTIPVGLIDDRTDEGAETVILTLTDSEGYTLGETQVHTLTITDNDTAGLRASPTTVHLAETGEQATVSVHLTSQPTAPVTVTFASSQGRVATVTPVALRFTPATWQTPQTVTVTAGADGVATLRGTVQSNDRGYAALASGALPHIRVRVGADLTGLTTPWLARFGRTVTSQAVTGVTARLSAARTPGLTGTVAGLALDRVGEEAASTQATTRLALAPSDPRLNPGGQQLTLRDILAGSAFALTSDPSATGGSYALWGQGAWTRFAGQAGAQDVEGNVLSGTLGVDWAQGAWVLGVAVSHTQGDGNAAQTTAQGDLESSLTLVTPYVGVDVTEHLSLWGTMGYGRGTVGLTRPTASEVETDLSLFLVAGGVRERLLEPAPTGGLAVAVRSEARFLRTMADADTAQGLAASEADVGLLRVGLESSWQQPLADGGAVVPRLDLGFRQDLGEAETGLGLEVQGGVRWEAPAHGLTLDVTGQTLLAHSDQEFETWGGSATVQWAANPNSAAGPALTLRQTYGAGTGTGATTFWTENPVALLQAPGPAELRLTADFGWGVPLQAGLGVPHVQYGWGPTSRDVTLGWRLLPTRATEMTLELTATHREAVRTAPVQGIALSLTRQW